MADDIDAIIHGVKSRGGREPEPTPAATLENDELPLNKMEGCFSSFPANKSLTRIHVMLGDGSVESLQYHHCDVKGKFKGGEFSVTFAGTKFWELRVKGGGPKFWRIYDLITLHRMAYIRQAIPHEAKFAAKGDTILTQIEIIDVTPKEHPSSV